MHIIIRIFDSFIWSKTVFMFLNLNSIFFKIFSYSAIRYSSASGHKENYVLCIIFNNNIRLERLSLKSIRKSSFLLHKRSSFNKNSFLSYSTSPEVVFPSFTTVKVISKRFHFKQFSATLSVVTPTCCMSEFVVFVQPTTTGHVIA